MIRKILFLLLIVLVVVLQNSILPVFISSHFKPDLLLIVTVFVALRDSFEKGAPLAWSLGLIKDVFSGLYLGLNAFIFLMLFLVIKSSSDRLYAESGELFIVTVTLASLASVVSAMLLSLMFTAAPGVAYSMLFSLIPHTAMNAFCASLVTLFPLFSSPVQENA
jgi:rod shape-determining protein MreD